jgi:hypothetical protein
MSSSSARLPPPPSFDGKASALDDWEKRMKVQMAWYQDLRANESSKVLFAAATLTGPALDWYAALTTTPASFDDLLALLRQRFQPILASLTARVQLDGLKQGKRPVQDYVSDFVRLIAYVPTMSQDDRTHRFLAGLSPALQDKVVQAAPTTLDDACLHAIRAEGRAGLMSAAFTGSSSAMDLSNTELSGESDVDAAAPAGLGALLQQLVGTQTALLERLNAVEHGMRGRNHQPSQRFDMSSLSGSLSQEQIRDRLDRRACFDCGQVGHRKGDARCPGRNKGQNNNRSRGPGKY